jgi:putative endonuclease
MSFFVYILTSRRNGTLYVGMTDNLVRRLWEHRNGLIPGFTKKYGVKMLVWYELHGNAGKCIPTRTPTEKMESGLEAALDRRNEPAVA